MLLCLTDSYFGWSNSICWSWNRSNCSEYGPQGVQALHDFDNCTQTVICYYMWQNSSHERGPGMIFFMLTDSVQNSALQPQEVGRWEYVGEAELRVRVLYYSWCVGCLGCIFAVAANVCNFSCKVPATCDVCSCPQQWISKSGRGKPAFQRNFSIAPKMESAVHIHLTWQCHISED
jgi:hypothetical protein